MGPLRLTAAAVRSKWPLVPKLNDLRFLRICVIHAACVREGACVVSSLEELVTGLEIICVRIAPICLACMQLIYTQKIHQTYWENFEVYCWRNGKENCVVSRVLSRGWGVFGAHKVHSVRIPETLQTLGFKNSFEYCLVLRHCLVSRYIAFGRGSRLSSSKAASEQGNKRTGKAQKSLLFVGIKAVSTMSIYRKLQLDLIPEMDVLYIL